MEKIIKKLNNLVPTDKLLHFFYGTIIYLITLVICSFQVGIKLGSFYSLIGVSVIAVLKEVYDFFNRDKHTPDVKDVIFTILSGVFFTAIIQFV